MVHIIFMNNGRLADQGLRQKMTYEIAQNVECAARIAEIIAIDLKRGKQILTVRFADNGEVRKTMAAMVTLTKFAPAEPLGQLLTEIKREARVRALRNIGTI